MNIRAGTELMLWAIINHGHLTNLDFVGETKVLLRMQISEKKSILVGGGVVLALVLVFAFLSGRQNLTSGQSAGMYRINAMFNKIDGLVEGNEVRLGGINVGTVTEQTLDKNYRAIIGMNIDSGVKLPSDTSAAIQTDSLFGSKFVNLEPGGEEKFLTPGAMITFTQDALIVSDLLDMIIAQGEKKVKEAALTKQKLKAIEKTTTTKGTN